MRFSFGFLAWGAPSHQISYHIVSYHKILYHIISDHIISYHIISYHIITYQIISYHIISYHIISYHIIPHPKADLWGVQCCPMNNSIHVLGTQPKYCTDNIDRHSDHSAFRRVKVSFPSFTNRFSDRLLSLLLSLHASLAGWRRGQTNWLSITAKSAIFPHETNDSIVRTGWAIQM